MYRTFNMGMGLAIIADSKADEIVETFTLAGFNAKIVGTVTDQAKTLTIPSRKLAIHD